jgi:amino acid permease
MNEETSVEERIFLTKTNYYNYNESNNGNHNGGNGHSVMDEHGNREHVSLDTILDRNASSPINVITIPENEEFVQYRKSRPIQSLVNIIKTFAGAGTFGLPWALKQSGVLTGVIGIVVMALLANYTMNLLVKCRRFIQAQEEYADSSDYWETRVLRQKIEVTDPREIEEMRRKKSVDEENDDEMGISKKFYKKAKRKKPLHWRLKFEGIPDDGDLKKLSAYSDKECDPNDYIYEKHRIFTYTDLGYEAMGQWGSMLVYALMFMCNLGVCTVYLTMISEIMESMVPQIPQRVWILFTIPIFVPLSWIRSYAFMTPVSMLGTLSLLVALGSVLIYGFTQRLEFIRAPWDFSFQYSVFNSEGFTLFVGVVLFLFNTHTMVLPIEQATTPRKSYGLTLRLGFSFIVFINLTFAVLVFLFFGLDIKDNALNNLPDKTAWVYVIKSCLVGELVFTFAVVLMPIAEILDEKVLYNLKNRYWPFILSGSVFRTLLVLFAVGIAEIFGPNFGVVMSAIGGLVSISPCGFYFLYKF